MFKRLCRWFHENRRVSRRIGWLKLIYANQRMMMATQQEVLDQVTNLVAQVDAQQTAIDGTSVLIDGVVVTLNSLKQQIADLIANGNDLSAIKTALTGLGNEVQQNADLLAANKAKLADAVQNTGP